MLTDPTLLLQKKIQPLTSVNAQYSNILIQNSSNIYNLCQIKSNRQKCYQLQKLVVSKDPIHWFNVLKVAVQEDTYTNVPTIITLMDAMDHNDGCYVDSKNITQKSQSKVIDIFNYKQCQLVLPLLFSTIRLCHTEFSMYNKNHTSCITTLVQDANRDRLYFWNQFCNFCMFFYIDIENQTVTDVEELTPIFTRFLGKESKITERTDIHFLAMEPNATECNILLEYKTRIYHVSHSLDSNQFKLNHVFSELNSMNVEYTLISSPAALFKCETILCGNCSSDDKQTHCMKLTRYQGKQWVSFLNVESKFCLHFDCCIFVKGGYIIIFRTECIYIVDCKTGILLSQISLLNSFKINCIGQYFAILQSESEQESDIKIGGFVREITKSSKFLPYPPQYLLQLILIYYNNEKIHLLRKHDGYILDQNKDDYIFESNGNYYCWILNVDDIFNQC